MKRAAVFGGGGVVGIAWSAGILHGLEEAGARMADADLLVGTSAGSIIAAQVACGEKAADMYARQRYPSPDSQEQFRPYSQEDADAANRKLMEKVAGDLVAARKRIGAYARRSETPAVAARRAIIASRLPGDEWPDRPLRLVAVDTDSGMPRVFDAASACPFIDAVAASCAVPGVWPPVPIDGAQYMDGGIASITNAWAAVAADRVLVVAPLGYSDGNPVSGHLRAEVVTLEARGASVRVLIPDAASLEAFGSNVLDPARRGPAAQAGHEQGVTLAQEIAAWWL
ncbi:patatin-like phospholipase family protein [Achromobacter aloeverae]|uniref:Patatin n=1 Tax=Achromobacter aloeverae TaxID=1750518 RepID=A0A4Q1HM57_9BURK|nr:patatin-like phospholipase family protein [Achromobacter aloeverae]RXN91366.1 patatin [Achromobacter aloeverae]